jgi:branched-chain amino acid transport system ATP-binding protein
MTALLTLDGMSRRFSGLVAVDAVSCTVEAGTIHAVIGPNGAGKTTLFNLVSGVLAPSSGRIMLDATDITRLTADRRARLGIARTFQNIRLFPGLTVLENVLTGLHPRLTATLADIVLRTPRFRREERDAVARARAALDFVGLSARAGDRPTALSYGDQRRLEIARAIAPAPRLLLLDEPAAGMNPAETNALATLVRRIRESGTTVLLVEHNMGFVMGLAERITVLNFGRLVFEGIPNEVRRAPIVIEAYLGAKVAARLAAA